MAQIQITPYPGASSTTSSTEEAKLGEVVALENVGPDAANSTWQIVSAPIGSSASLSATSGSTTDFTPDKAGSYLISCTDGDGEDRKIVAVLSKPLPLRAPAFNEQLEWGTNGWAEHRNRDILRLSHVAGDLRIVARAAAALSPGDIVTIASTSDSEPLAKPLQPVIDNDNFIHMDGVIGLVVGALDDPSTGVNDGDLVIVKLFGVSGGSSPLGGYVGYDGSVAVAENSPAAIAYVTSHGDVILKPDKYEVWYEYIDGSIVDGAVTDYSIMDLVLVLNAFDMGSIQTTGISSDEVANRVRNSSNYVRRVTSYSYLEVFESMLPYSIFFRNLDDTIPWSANHIVQYYDVAQVVDIDSINNRLVVRYGRLDCSIPSGGEELRPGTPVMLADDGTALPYFYGLSDHSNLKNAQGMLRWFNDQDPSTFSVKVYSIEELDLVHWVADRLKFGSSTDISITSSDANATWRFWYTSGGSVQDISGVGNGSLTGVDRILFGLFYTNSSGVLTLNDGATDFAQIGTGTDNGLFVFGGIPVGPVAVDEGGTPVLNVLPLGHSLYTRYFAGTFVFTDPNNSTSVPSNLTLVKSDGTSLYLQLVPVVKYYRFAMGMSPSQYSASSNFRIAFYADKVPGDSLFISFSDLQLDVSVSGWFSGAAIHQMIYPEYISKNQIMSSAGFGYVICGKGSADNIYTIQLYRSGMFSREYIKG